MDYSESSYIAIGKFFERFRGGGKVGFCKGFKGGVEIMVEWDRKGGS